MLAQALNITMIKMLVEDGENAIGIVELMASAAENLLGNELLGVDSFAPGKVVSALIDSKRNNWTMTYNTFNVRRPVFTLR